MRRNLRVAVFLPLTLLACVQKGPPVDAGRARDARASDAGTGPDAGTTDAGRGEDAGPRDAGARDAGPLPDIPVTFTEVAAEVGLTASQNTNGACAYAILEDCEPAQYAGGAAVADVDGDGRLDLYLTATDRAGRLYRFDGTRYEDVTADYGLLDLPFRTNGATFVDVDRDGDEDLYLTTHVVENERTTPEDPSRFVLLLREGDRFVEGTLERGAGALGRLGAPARAGASVAVGDYDRDGWPDLHVNEWIGEFHNWPPHTRLLRNRGATAPGHFLDTTASSGALSVTGDCWEGFEPCGAVAFSSAFGDLDNDGWPDLAVVKDYRRSLLFWNNGDGTFVDGTASAGVGTDENGMGSTFGDVDNDGDLDWFITSIGDPYGLCGPMPCQLGYTGNRLYRNDGGRRFTDITGEADVRHGGWGWGAAFVDYDNDTDLDLVMTNGMIYPDSPEDDEFRADLMRFWENDGTAHFEERSADVGLTDTSAGKGLVVFDYDNDGDQDILIVVNGAPPLLYRNDRGNEAGSFLRVRVRGTVSTLDALGARVHVRVREDGPRLMREVGSVTHYLGQSERVVHVGLGYGVEEVHEVEVRWPSGRSVRFENVEVNRVLDVTEPDG